MARKEIDKKWKDHVKKIDKMFDKRDKTLFRNDYDISNFLERNRI